MNNQPINVTEPFLPPLEEYVEYLKGIWDRNWLTNQGPLVKELEQKLQTYHDLAMPVHCVANGALGLQIAIKALGVTGEVITTPFSYVATTSCPLWEGCTVKFADIEPDTLTIDPKAVEAAITSKTQAIIATHVFGNPCDCEALESIAEKHGLALIFDAAHAFGVVYKGKNILEYGNASMVSLHATKLMHSVEGGFVVAKDSIVSEKMEWIRRFGHNGARAFHGIGTNAKMSEFHAAMGLCNLNYINSILERRRIITEAYDEGLFCRMQDGARKFISTIQFRNQGSRNYSYYPVIFESESELLTTVEQLEAENIFPRRYFSPSLNQVTELVQANNECSVSSAISRAILCLPVSASMDTSAVSRICGIINRKGRRGI